MPKGKHPDVSSHPTVPLDTEQAAGAQTQFRAGDLVGGRYRVVDYLATGGMGEVYEATDETLRERVALKTIRPELAVDPRARERFKREIQLARKVTHPNVCRTFDVGFHDQI